MEKHKLSKIRCVKYFFGLVWPRFCIVCSLSLSQLASAGHWVWHCIWKLYAFAASPDQRDRDEQKEWRKSKSIQRFAYAGAKPECPQWNKGPNPMGRLFDGHGEKGRYSFWTKVRNHDHTQKFYTILPSDFSLFSTATTLHFWWVGW